MEEALSDALELPAVFLLATGLKFIWLTRAEKKQITVHKMRSEMEAKISILRKSRHKEAGDKMLEILRS